MRMAALDREVRGASLELIARGCRLRLRPRSGSYKYSQAQLPGRTSGSYENMGEGWQIRREE
jgi:hypothetical protein